MMSSPSTLTSLRLAATLFALLSTTAASAADLPDMPKRKAGLWQIETTMAGMPSMGAMQQCIDEKTDNFYRQIGQDMAKDCSALDIKRDGDRISVRSVCKFGQTTSTSEAVFSGKFESAYRGEVKTSYNPPLHGMSRAQMTIAAKWLGACKPGQKPGDMVMPNGMTVNAEQMKQMSQGMRR